jgi:hypothetical protein
MIVNKEFQNERKTVREFWTEVLEDLTFADSFITN